ncbi:ArsR/SmtB family transcription factor [Paenibacillus macerans]|uniref:ArsR/SmtB family transcription factor n=1 Tax=Paenibacillus macerans TaxID=44252 RepID=UPI003D31607F
MSAQRPTPMAINAEQSKLLESALRIKIMNVLADEPHTSKQVADLLGKTPGNVHYHIQKLYDGGLLDLVKTQTVGGVVEKYYRSKATYFKEEQFKEFAFLEGDPPYRAATRLLLSAGQRQAFIDEMDALIRKWESMDTDGDEYGVLFTLGRVQESDPASE